VLQERRIERLGSNVALPVEFRVIAATKADLGQLGHEGRFRSDLYYRLNVAVLRMPPLRERRDDIPVLFEHFAMEAAHRHARPPLNHDPRRLQLLLAHHWPGNVRELRNVAERCVLGIEAGFPPFGNNAPQTVRPLAATVEAFERALLADALARNAGSLARTADALQIAKTTLHDKLRKHGLPLG
jgi:two-component system C4-dicarboxylate transport response regulator DctD